jgi:hypothetical protein
VWENSRHFRNTSVVCYWLDASTSYGMASCETPMSHTVNPTTLQQQYQQLGDRPGDALEVAADRLTLSGGLFLAPVLMRLIRFLGIDYVVH